MNKFKNLLPYLAITGLLLTACGDNTEAEEKPENNVDETEEIVDIEDDIEEENEEIVHKNAIEQPLLITTNIVAIYPNYYEKGDMSKPSPMDHESDVRDFKIETDFTSDDPVFINYNTDDSFLVDIRENPERYFDGLDNLYLDIYNIANTSLDENPIAVARNNRSDSLFNFEHPFSNGIDDVLDINKYQFYMIAHSNLVGLDLFTPEPTSSKIVVINKQLDEELSNYYNAPSQVSYLKDSDKMLKELMQTDESTIIVESSNLSHYVRTIYENENHIIGFIPSRESIQSFNETSEDKERLLHVDIFNEYLDIFTSDEVIDTIEKHLK